MKPLSAIPLFCACLASPAVAQEFRFDQFDVPNARLTRPFGVNASGLVVGTFLDGGGKQHGFLRNIDGHFTQIDYPGAIVTNAVSINARGDIVGRWTDANGVNHVYLLSRGRRFTSFDPPAPCVPSARPTVAHGINDIGDIVGRCFDAGEKELGWIWRHDGSFDVLDVPSALTTDAWLLTNREVIVGDYTDDSMFVHGYVRTAEEGFVTFDVPGYQTGVRAMNERGDVTGIYSDSDGVLHGFLYRDGEWLTIDFPGSSDGGGTLVINETGLLVGGFVDADGDEHGFIARECPQGLATKDGLTNQQRCR